MRTHRTERKATPRMRRGQGKGGSLKTRVERSAAGKMRSKGCVRGGELALFLWSRCSISKRALELAKAFGFCLVRELWETRFKVHK